MFGLFGQSRSENDDDENTQEENRHSVVSPEYCDKMAKKYGWDLDRVEKTDRDPLPYECVFKGKHISFWDMWQDHQDAED